MSELKGGQLRPDALALFKARLRERIGTPGGGEPEHAFRPLSEGQGPVQAGGFLVLQGDSVSGGVSPFLNSVLGPGNTTAAAITSSYARSVIDLTDCKFWALNSTR